LQTLLIPPNRFRPPVQLGEAQYEHPINAALKEVMLNNDEMFTMLKDKNADNVADDDGGGLDGGKLMQHWHGMQVETLCAWSGAVHRGRACASGAMHSSMRRA
jgi:hypothetical protein